MFTEFEDEVSLPKNDVQSLASDSYRASPTFLIFHSPKVGVPPPNICILFMLGGTSNNTTHLARVFRLVPLKSVHKCLLKL
jgi:hypothetical protein